MKFYSVYSGHHSILIPPSEVEVNPALWLTTVSQFKVSSIQSYSYQVRIYYCHYCREKK